MKQLSYMGIPRKDIKWNPSIDEDKCIGCGQCIEICPNGVFVMNETTGKANVANPNNCVVLCDKCKHFCEQGALSFPDKELVKKFISERLRDLAQQAKTSDDKS